MTLLKMTLQSSGGAFDLDLVFQTLSDMVRFGLARLPYVIVGGIVFIFFVIGGRIAKRLLLTAGRRTRLDLTLSDLFGRLVNFFIVLLGLFVAAVVIFPTFQPGDLIAGLGITSVAIGFAFKDVLQNFFAGILILWRQPFLVGDQIRLKEYEGTVEEITIRSTRLKTYDGERAVIPNGEVYTNAVLVRTAYDRRRIRFNVGIGYPDSIEEARETIIGVLKEAEGVLEDPPSLVYVAELAPSSVNFHVYFWVQSDQANVLAVSDRVATGIKLALDGVGIDMPFPHSVVLFHDTTGTRVGDIKREDYLSRRDGREQKEAREQNKTKEANVEHSRP